MATQVQFRGGDTDDNDAFRGAAREITVDTQKDTLVVHDGATTGGFPLFRASGGAQDISTSGDVSAADGTFTGDVDIADKIVHTGDTNTAIRFPSADTVTVETAGSEALRINSSGNVGIGTTSPSTLLHVDGAATFTGGVLTGAYDSGNSSTSGLSLQDSGRVIARRQTGSDVLWLGLHGATTGSEITAAGAATFAGYINTSNNVWTGERYAETGEGCYIGGNGQIQARCDTGAYNVWTGFKDGYGSGDITSSITAAGAADFSGYINTTAVVYTGDAYNGNEGCYLAADGMVWGEQAVEGNDVFRGKYNGTTTSTIKGSGAATFAGSVKIGGTAAANEMDEYEEGTFTPTLGKWTGTPSNITYTTQSGKYTKIGDIVHVQLAVAVSAGIDWTGTSNALTIEGLPFTVGHNNFRVATPGNFTYQDSSTSYYPTDFGWMLHITRLYTNTSSTGSSWTTTFDGSTATKLNFTYSTASL